MTGLVSLEEVSNESDIYLNILTYTMKTHFRIMNSKK